MFPTKKQTYFVAAFLSTLVFLSAIVSGFVFRHFGLESNLSYASAVEHMVVLAASALVLIVLVEAVSPFIVPDATWNTALIALFILLTVLCSNDFIGLLNYWGAKIDPTAFPGLLLQWGFYSFGLLTLVFVFRFFCHDYSQEIPRRARLITRFIFIANYLLYIALTFAQMQWIAAMLTCLVVIYWGVSLTHAILSSGRWNAVAIFAMSIGVFSLAMVVSEAVSYTFTDVFFGVGITSMLALLITVMFFSIYLIFAVMAGRKMTENAKKEKQLEEMRNNILKNQISPHFLFNSLNVVKAAYRENKERGDYALDLLSRLLRYFTEAADITLVPLNKELDLVNSYLQLYTLKTGHEVPLIFNIVEEGYEVPFFSLQPLLENALTYSGIDSKEDGYIQIDSYREDGCHVLIFSDNGVGFDPKEIKPDSYGIKNVKARLKLSLHASMEVESSLGEGTRVIIRIPINQEGNL